MVIHSKNATFLIGKETTFGTAVTADKDVGLVQNFSPSDKREHTKVYAAGSREIQEIVAGKIDLKYDLELFLQNGRVFEYLIGSVGHVETTGDWTHTFTLTDTLPSMTIEESYNISTDVVFIRDGCKFIDGTISIDKGGILTFKGSLTSASVDTSTASASAAVISSLGVLAYKHTTLSTGSAGSETSVGKLQSFTLTFGNDVEDIEQAGSVEICEAEAKNLDISGEFTMMFENKTEYDVFLGGTSPVDQPASTSIVINANNGVTLGSGRVEFNVQLANAQYEEAGKPLAVGDVIIQTFRFNAETLGTNKLTFVDDVSSANFA